MPLPALVELPQLTALSLAWRRLVDLKPVLMLVNNTGLVCCWEQRGRWQQRVVGWPAEAELPEDQRLAGRSAPDPHPSVGSPGTFVSAVTQPDLRPWPLMV